MGWPAKYRVSSVCVLAVGMPVTVFGVAVKSSHLGLFAAAIAFGFVLGTFGHIIRSRPLIVTGILVIALASGYYVFLLEPAGG
jgi:hypothetical protein